jgi:subtilisin
MTSRSLAFLLAFSLFIALPEGASAAADGSGGRYFVETNRSFWRNAMGARHVFEDGFTADLSDLQVGIAKLAGLKPVPVVSFSILSEVADETISPTPQTTPSQSVPWGVRTVLNDLELQTTSGGVGTHIAVLDTGVERTHADLQRRIVGCADFTDTVRGLVDDRCEDLNGHGTHVTGILAADGGTQETGSFGLAPQASVSAFRVCHADGSCFSDDIAVAIRYAVDAGANIIVLGMGGEAPSSLMHDALVYADARGVLVVVGAGNDGPYEDSIDWPAYDPLTVAVAAVDNKNEPAEFSSQGLNLSSKPFTSEAGDVDFAAPGVNIESTYRGGGYAILSGTSMAAPHVAGLAALVWQADAENPAHATRLLLQSMAQDIADVGDDNSTGRGIPTLID